MNEALNKLIRCIGQGDEVIITGFGIDEKVIYALLENKLDQIRTLRLIYQHQMIANPGFIQQMCLNTNCKFEIIRTPIFITRASKGVCSVYHSKLIAIKDSRKGKIKCIGIPSFNWTPYHFSSRRSVFDSFIVFEGKRVQNLEQILDLPEFSAKKDKALVKIPPRLLMFVASDGEVVSFKSETSRICKVIQGNMPAKVEEMAAPHMNEKGLDLLLGEDWRNSHPRVCLYSASSKKGDQRLHAKILIGAREGGSQILWMGSLNFTQNAVGGNNHETLVILDSNPDVLAIRKKLQEFMKWTPESVDQRDPEEDEPGIASMPNEFSPTYAELIEKNGAPYVRVSFSPQKINNIRQFRLIPPRGEDVLISKLVPISSSSVDLPLKSRESSDDKVRGALNCMWKFESGRVGMEINHQSVEVELDLGILWDMAQGIGLPVYNGSQGKRKVVKTEESWVPYFSGTDVRPLRALSSIGNRKSTKFLDWLLNKGRGEIVNWVKNWRQDPWSNNE